MNSAKEGTLALLGGPPVRTAPYPPYNTIGEDEKREVQEVLESGVLSAFIARHGDFFLGGPKVRALEEAFCTYFGAKHAVSVNSATSGLHAAVAAAGIGPGDEVIVSPYTMSASATAILMQNAIPVFADIDEDIFCLDPRSVEAAVTPQTKAILVTHLFGHPADMDRLSDVARAHNLIIIEDNAQAPGALWNGRPTGTLGHLGVFSLNCHKTIQTGEGGMVLTNDDDLALRLALVRNHGEAVVGDMGYEAIENTMGWNYRMTELSAAVGLGQIKKLDRLTDTRIRLADYLTKRLKEVPGLTPPLEMSAAKHVYYVYPVKYNAGVAGLPRDLFVRAVNAEGTPVIGGYVRPLYWEPMFQRRIVYGRSGCPYTCGHYQGTVSYERGLCPVAERMHTEELLFTTLCRWPLAEREIDELVTAMQKVLANKDVLLAAGVAQ